MQKFSKTRILVECAIMIAIGTILATFPKFDMPFGGSITICSMLPFILVSLRHGVKWGLITGFANSLLQMLLGFYAPPSNTVLAFVGVILLDYILAFTLLGTAQLFASKFKNRGAGVITSTAIVCFIRFICSFLSGALLWGSYQSYYEWADGLNVWVYSLLYNGSYMIPETILCVVAMAIIYKTAPRIVNGSK